MRLILSRKGFDSASGGCPSPIMPDGSMHSLPIPDRASDIPYAELEWQGVNVGQLVADLTGDPRRRTHHAHLDPDVERQALPRQGGWRPVFGQTGSAQGHLRRQGVGPGDLFLFFGLFRRVEQGRGGWRFVSRSPARHILWGWLQVGELHAVDSLAADALPWARYHPHFRGDRGANNTLYVAASRLCLPGERADAPGAGIFPQIDAPLVLTAPGAAGPSQWQLPAAFFPSRGRVPLSHHGKPDRWRLVGGDRCFLQSVSRGQEFVLDLAHYPAVAEWATHLFDA
ncbi:MAG: hypothetical protein F4Y86_03895 [Gammaproteobacteria bacterium]|nr:hypothetical protein [Gammaproteobacteria bacterium]MYB37552.1 hypothetical protein [Gammaproteobacteria bacterium]